MNRTKGTHLVTTVVLLCSLLLVSCGGTPTATPTALKPTTALTAAPTTQAPAATKAPATAAAAAPTPTRAANVGGTLVYAVTYEPDTLDPHATTLGPADSIMVFIGAGLVAMDHDHQIVPYLAESWKASDDGLTWEFKIKKGAKFHDGTPVTAQDFAYTFDRIVRLKAAGTNLVDVLESTSAPDDSTFRVKLKQPYYPFLVSLAGYGFSQVLSKAATEKLGQDFGRQPIGAGPYKFSSWKTGDRIVLERNPDYNWGPDFAKGPYNISTIVFRVIPEYATQMAGLESGEVDIVAQVAAKDVSRLKDLKHISIVQSLPAGSGYTVFFNVSKSPFDDVRVRQALNSAVDHQTLIDLTVQGAGKWAVGPISETVSGYWPGVEELAYKLDLAKAKDLMKQAGYTPGANGMLQKDGRPFKLVLNTPAETVTLAEVLKEQFKALGVEVEISLLELSALRTEFVTGNYETSIWSYGDADIEILWLMFHSSQIGAMNRGQIRDPELDTLLDLTRTLTDPAKRQEACNAVQKLMVEKAYTLPLCVPTQFFAVNSRIRNCAFPALLNSAGIATALAGAYIPAD